MFETLLGGFLGGVLRIVPELLKWLDRASERKHELNMQDKALEFEKQRGASKMAEIGAYAQDAWNTGALETFRASIAAQGQKSGVKWVDALSISVRPVVTYWFMALYCATKIATFIAAFHAGADWITAVRLIWTSEDMVIWSGMLNFWFLGRVFEKTGRV